MYRDAMQNFAEIGEKQSDKKVMGAPIPLSQCVTDIVKLYKDCSSFVEIPVDDSQERFNSAYGQRKS